MARAVPLPQLYGASLQQISKLQRIPAPMGGWNAREGLAEMPRTDAVILDNMIPGATGVSLRAGSLTWATIPGGNVQSLLEYAPPSASNRLFAASGNALYEVTAGGNIVTPALSGLHSALWQSENFSTPGGNFLVACSSGADPVQNFNGTTWSQPAITGVSSNNLVNVAVFANRLWFVELNTLHMWYLPIDAIAGAASLIDLGPVAFLGGSLVAIGVWNQIGGMGPQSLLVCVTSKGQAVVYQGTDPSQASTWALVGTFRISEPAGYRCLSEQGADLAVITPQGLLPISQVLPIDIAGQARAAATDKIKNAFQASYKLAPNDPGWQVADYTVGGLLIVNVPLGDGQTAYQYVMNRMNGSWCRFTGLNAYCWSLMGSTLFFGCAGGVVKKYDVLYTDDGNPIPFVVMPAFSDFMTPAMKQFLMARPLFQAPRNNPPPIVCKLDYDTSVPAFTQPILTGTGTPWGSPWGSPWSQPNVSQATWQNLEGIGAVGTFLLSAYSKTAVVLHHADIVYLEGGIH